MADPNNLYARQSASAEESARALQFNEAQGADRVRSRVAAGVAKNAAENSDPDDEQSDDAGDSAGESESGMDKAVKIGGSLTGPWGWIFKKIIYPFLKTITGMH